MGADNLFGLTTKIFKTYDNYERDIIASIVST